MHNGCIGERARERKRKREREGGREGEKGKEGERGEGERGPLPGKAPREPALGACLHDTV